MATEPPPTPQPGPLGPPRLIHLRFNRVKATDQPFAFDRTAQDYLLHFEGVGSEGFAMPWSAEMVAALGQLQDEAPPPRLALQVGDTLKQILPKGIWGAVEERVRASLDAGRPVELVIECDAAELFDVPWELVTLGENQTAIGATAGVQLRFVWPHARVPPRTPRSRAPQVLFAWSAGPLGVRASTHFDALQNTWCTSRAQFGGTAHTVQNMSRGELDQALRLHKPDVLHILCHGGVGPDGGAGLVLAGEAGAEADVITGPELARLLQPHFDTLRLVVLCACRGGAGAWIGDRLPSPALALTQAGCPAVVATRFLMDMEASAALSRALYSGLVTHSEPLDQAVARARSVSAAYQSLDVVGLQVWGNLTEDSDPRPIRLRPFRGLAAFQQSDAAWFHGRTAEVDRLEQRILAALERGRPALQVVAGASGSGKSSLVRAGLIPRLARHPAGGFSVTVVRPSEPKALNQALERLAQPSQQRALLVVDQLEELFTHVQDPDQRSRMARSIWALAADPALPVAVVATIRVDQLGRLGEVVLDDGTRLDQIAYNDAHRTLVAQPGPAQLREAITAPIERVGMGFTPGLVDTIVGELSQASGALPLMQYALDQLWAHSPGRTLSTTTYNRIGGVVGALTQAAEAAVGTLDTLERAQARTVLVEAVELSGTQLLRRQVNLSRLRPHTPKAQAAFDRAIEVLESARLVTLGVTEDGQEQTLDIVHEALIHRWDTLGDWIEADRERLLKEREVLGWATLWTERKADADAGASYLIGGHKLDRAEELLASASPGFLAHAGGFIRASRQAVDALARRERRITQAGIAAGILFLLFLIGATLNARHQAKVEEASRIAAVNATAMGAAQRIGRTDPTTELAILKRVNEGGRTDVWAQSVVAVARTGVAQAVLRGHDAPLVSGGFDRRNLWVLTTSQDGTAVLAQADGLGSAIRFDPGQGPLIGGGVLPDGVTVVTVAAAGKITAWNRDGTRLWTSDYGAPVRSWAMGAGGLRVALGGEDGGLAVFSVDDGHAQARHSPTLAGAALTHLGFSPNGKRIVGGDTKGRVQVWHNDRDVDLLGVQAVGSSPVTAMILPQRGGYIVGLESGPVLRSISLGETVNAMAEPPQELFAHLGRVNSLSLDAHGRRLCTTSSDRTIRLFDIDYQTEAQLAHDNYQFMDCVWRQQRNEVIASTAFGPVVIFPVDSPESPATLLGHNNSVPWLELSLNEKRLLSVGYDGTARVWNLESVIVPRTVIDLQTGLNDLALGFGDREAVAMTLEGKAIVIDLHSGEVLHTFAHTTSPALTGALSADGVHLAVSFGDGRVRIWDRMDLDAAPTELPGHHTQIWSVAWRSDDQALLTADETGNVLEWLLADPSKTQEMKGQAAFAWNVDYGNDDTVVMATGSGGRVMNWERSTGDLVWCGQGTQDTCPGIALGTHGFKPDFWNTSLVSPSTPVAWPPDPSRGPLKLLGHQDVVWWIDYDAAGDLAVSTSRDGTARIWPLSSEALANEAVGLILRHPRDRIVSASISEDGTFVLTATEQGLIQRWEVPAPMLTRQHVEAWIDTNSNVCLSRFQLEELLRLPPSQANREAEACAAELVSRASND